MGMRNGLNKFINKNNSVSHMRQDNDLSLITDTEPFSVMRQDDKRKFPEPENFGSIRSDKHVSELIGKLWQDEVEAIAAYKEAYTDIKYERPDIAYILSVIGDEERNHLSILKDIQRSILGSGLANWPQEVRPWTNES